METNDPRWPYRDRLLDIAWVLFAVASFIAMLAFPSWETVPFHLIWVSLTIAYGFRVWGSRMTSWTLVAVTALTGIAVGRDVIMGAQPLDEITEVPLMAAMFVAMAWHAQRRLAAMREVKHVSDANRRLLEREERFVQDASHQLRTPITIALGNAQLIQRSSDGQTTEDATIVVEELLRLRRMADLLLLMAATERGEPALRATTDMCAMAMHTLRRWAATSRDWGIDTLEHAFVFGDADRLQMVLDELIANAVAHTDSGDSITLGVHRQDGSVIVSVKDSGAGIDQRDLGKIFDRFARSMNGQERTRGVGLGLSFVKSVAEAHGGGVRVQSSLGEGSVFELFLPALDPAFEPLTRKATPASPVEIAPRSSRPAEAPAP